MADVQEHVEEVGNAEIQQEDAENFEEHHDEEMKNEAKEGKQDAAEGEGDQDGDAGNDAPADTEKAEIQGRDEDKKLFVGGLGWGTTEKNLKEHFSKFGEVERVNVKTDPNTGRSRGFAFITFSNAEAIDAVLSAGDHIIKNKKVDPKKAKARPGKIVVSGLVPELSEDNIKAYFAEYGNIIEFEIPFDAEKNVRKDFCLITFDSEQDIQDLLKNPKQSINGNEVNVRKAVPEPKPEEVAGGGRGGVRGRGRGRGDAGRGRGGVGRGRWDQGAEQGAAVRGGYGNYGYGGYDNPGQNYDNQGYGGGKQRGVGLIQRHQPY